MSKMKSYMEDEKEKSFNDGHSVGYRLGLQDALSMLNKYKEHEENPFSSSSYHKGVNHGLQKQFNAIRNGLEFESLKILGIKKAG